MTLTSASCRSKRQWTRLRLQVLRRDGFRCVVCAAGGRLEVDHIEAVRRAPERAFDPDNLQSLCPSCHARKTGLEQGKAPINHDRLRWTALLKEQT